MTPLHRWDGRYVGFRVADHLYSADGRPFGWVDDEGVAWHADGRYLGVVEDSYVVRDANVERRTRRRMHPARPMRPLTFPKRQPRLGHGTLVDGLAWLGDDTPESQPTQAQGA